MEPTPDQVDLYRSLFGRVGDAYGEVVNGKVSTIREPVTDELIMAHLAGSRRLGFFLVDLDGMVDRGYIDVDLPKDLLKNPETTEDEIQEHWEAARARVVLCAVLLEYLKIEFYIESSRSKGFHLVVHASEPIPASLMKQFLTAVVEVAQVQAEVFPKQESRSGPSGLGNFVFGMLQGRSIPKGKTVIVNWRNGFKPVPDSWAVLEGLKKNSLETIGAALAYLREDAADLSTPPGGCTGITQQPPIPHTKTPPKLLDVDLIGVGFEKCERFAAFMRNAVEVGRLLPDRQELDHAARVALGCYAKAFEGGEEWIDKAVYRHLDDYDPKKTAYQLASLRGKPPLCSSAAMCPNGKCPAILELGGESPIKFVFAEGRAHGFTEYEAGAPATVVTIPQEAQAPRTPDFPAEVMTGAAGAFAHLFSSYMEVPKHFFFMSYLTCLGIFLADSLTIDSELRPQPRLYTLLLGESADDRKSTAISKTISFFKDATFGFNVCWGVGSAEGLQKRMEGNNKLLLAFDEFMAFVGKCRIEGSVLLPCVNSLFENNWYESQTKKNEVILSNAHLAILAASTIQTYEKTWSSQFTDIGFNNRLWLVTGKGQRKYSCPRTIPEESKRLARKKLSAVLDHAGKHPVLQMMAGARDLYDDWYMGRERTIHWKRLDTYALRFMPLLAVNDLKNEIDVGTVRKVIALCDHQHHVRQLHDPVDADNAVAKLEEKIRRILKVKGSIGNRELKRALHVNQTGLWLYNTAIKNLSREKEVGFDKKSGGYFLHAEGVTTAVTGDL